MNKLIMEALYKGFAIWIESFFKTAARKGMLILSFVGFIIFLGGWVYNLHQLIERKEDRFEHKLDLVQAQWSAALNDCNKRNNALEIKVALLEREVDALTSKKR